MADIPNYAGASLNEATVRSVDPPVSCDGAPAHAIDTAALFDRVKNSLQGTQ